MRCFCARVNSITYIIDTRFGVGRPRHFTRSTRPLRALAAPAATAVAELPEPTAALFLLNGLIAGDQAALGGAYDLYATRVHGLALRVLADASLAEEVTQDVFLSAWSHRAQFDPARGSLLPWLLTTTRNRSIDVIRARRGVGPLESEGGREVRSPLDVEAAVLTNLDRQAVVEAVAALPALQRSAIEQAYFGGHRLREIADSAGVPIGTIKGRMRLGLQKLAADLTLRGAVTRSQR